MPAIIDAQRSLKSWENFFSGIDARARREKMENETLRTDRQQKELESFARMKAQTPREQTYNLTHSACWLPVRPRKQWKAHIHWERAHGLNQRSSSLF